ncbi:MAG: hypothetical protein LCH26_03110 [Proteobacteria bacterium]|nr:hypothetical protein [Pseudomonadota bacterium]
MKNQKIFSALFSLIVMTMAAQGIQASAAMSGDRLERQVVMMERMLTPSFPQAMIPESLKRLDVLMTNENLAPSQKARLETVKAALMKKTEGAPHEAVMPSTAAPVTADVRSQIKAYINESALISGAPKAPDARRRLDALRMQINQTLKNPSLNNNEISELKEILGDVDAVDAIVPKARL